VGIGGEQCLVCVWPSAVLGVGCPQFLVAVGVCSELRTSYCQPVTANRQLPPSPANRPLPTAEMRAEFATYRAVVDVLQPEGVHRAPFWRVRRVDLLRRGATMARTIDRRDAALRPRVPSAGRDPPLEAISYVLHFLGWILVHFLLIFKSALYRAVAGLSFRFHPPSLLSLPSSHWRDVSAALAPADRDRHTGSLFPAPTRRQGDAAFHELGAFGRRRAGTIVRRTRVHDRSCPSRPLQPWTIEQVPRMMASSLCVSSSTPPIIAARVSSSVSSGISERLDVSRMPRIVSSARATRHQELAPTRLDSSSASARS